MWCIAKALILNRVLWELGNFIRIQGFKTTGQEVMQPCS